MPESGPLSERSVGLPPRPVPELIERASGGWLAVSQPGSVLRIGVTADDELKVRAVFEREVDRWLELLAIAAEREADDA